MIIVLEGADGCGKSSVAKGVVARRPMRPMSFPMYDTPTGKLIKQYLNRLWWVDGSEDSAKHLRLHNALAFQALQSLNKLEAQHELELFAGSLDRDLILCRYWHSAWVYGQLDGLEAAWLQAVHAPLVQPDISILLDVAPPLAIARCDERKQARERYEGDESLVAQTVRLYRKLWAQHADDPAWCIVSAADALPTVIDNTLEAILRARRELPSWIA